MVAFFKAAKDAAAETRSLSALLRRQVRLNYKAVTAVDLISLLSHACHLFLTDFINLDFTFAGLVVLAAGFLPTPVITTVFLTNNF